MWSVVDQWLSGVSLCCVDPYETGRFAKPNPETVTTYAHFVQFLDRMARDYRQSGHDEWENRNLGDYLETLGRYARDCVETPDDREQVKPDLPSWNRVASLLYGATGYE